MKLGNLTTALTLTALLFGTSAHAVLPHEVKCANGQTLEIPDSVTAWEACLTINSRGVSAAGAERAQSSIAV